MRVLICGDVHWSTYSSIIRRRGTDYSKRLENCINSINWVEETAEEYKCDQIIYLGDFFDRAELNSEEISALKEIQWSSIKHQILVGNHELGSADGQYNTVRLFNLLPNFEVIDKPKVDAGFGYYFLYLPYIFEQDRKSITEYFNSCFSTHDFVTQEFKNTFIFSHNDLKGVNYGMFESKEGFEVEDIKNHCAMCFNGHIHNNGEVVPDKIINVGNLTGQNFNEDGTKYQHRICLLDINGNDYKIYQIINPYAYMFYKAEINNEQDINKLVFSPHAIVSAKCVEYLVPKLRETFDNNASIEEYRIITMIESSEAEQQQTTQLASVDHLAQFQSYILEHLGSTDSIVKELQEVTNGSSI